MPRNKEDIVEDEEQEETDKKGKGRKKRDKKKKGDQQESFDATVTNEGAMYTDAESDEEGGSASVVLIVIFIVFIWLAILGLLIKLDIGGFGSNVLYPVLKDVPVVNMILPSGVADEAAADESDYKTLADAVAEINRLNEEIDQLKSEQENAGSTSDEEVASLKEEIKRLQTFEDSQVEFQKIKTEFYEEVVFSDNAPDIEEYKAYYESIDPENAEYIYKQVIQQIETNQEMDEYVKAYSEMKPKQAAAIFEMMTDNLDLVAKILGEMDTDSRANILGVMDSQVASQITKIMDPE
ncbi:MAG TPA: hypothetical protein PLU43_10180 [Lachnospiraceae bacterium]|nr:hypothetical protein [Lachnospiraceae bacterium]